MLNNYFRIAWRHLWKNKLFLFINVGGLAVGMAACLVIFRFVSFELSYDTFHENRDRIYRVVFYNYTQGKFEGKSASTTAGLGPAIENTFPENTDFVRVIPQSETVVTYRSNEGEVINFVEDKLAYADPSFFDVFSFPLIKGNASTVLSAPHTVVISASIASKYFSNEDPVGKLLSIGEGDPFRVEGVFEDMPKNSHLQFDFIRSYQTLGNQKDQDWSWLDTYTYLLLPPSASAGDLEAKLAAIVSQHYREGSLDSYHLQGLPDIYLDDSFRSTAARTGSARTVYFLIAIGTVLMFIALINFINLTTVKNLDRIKEIGIRKVIGASRKQLSQRFLIEAGLLNSLALLLAVGLALVATSFLERWNWLDFPSGPQYWFWLFVGGLLLVNTCISGLFPTFFSTFFPTAIQSLKMNTKPSFRGIGFSKVLIVFQFTASLGLLTGIVIIDQQISFMREQELAIDISQTLVIRAPLLTDQSTASQFQAFKHQLENYSAISHITHSTSVPGELIDWNRSDIKLRSTDTEPLYPSNIIAVGHDFVTTYGLHILAGRDFQEEIASDESAMLINEAAARQFGFSSLEEGLGQYVFIGERAFEVIGVVNDYHHLSLKEAIDPILYFIGSTRRPIYSIKLSTENLSTTVITIKSIWEQLYPGNVFSYFFLDEFFEQQYQSDQQFRAVSSLFSGLTLLLACTGLFGLASYTTVQRTKEIGVRKVLGASIANLLYLLSKGHLKLILISFLVAAPITNFFFTEWLNEFAYRVTLQWWMFVAPGTVVLLISLLSIAGKTVKAASKNPVDSLQYE
ncbi:MAG: ABC transporter permease [Bacteroidota bacterium]